MPESAFLIDPDRICLAANEAKGVVFTDERRGRTYSNHIYPAIDKTGKVISIAAVAIDITESKRAQEALERREELLRFGFEAASMGVWEWHVEADSVVLSPSLTSVRSADLTSGPGAMAKFISDIHPDDQQRVEASLRACAEGRAAVHTMRYRRQYSGADGNRVVWLSPFSRSLSRSRSPPFDATRPIQVNPGEGRACLG